MKRAEERAALFLARAKQADEHAIRLIDPLAKKAWEIIAESYRDLARYPGRWVH